MTEKSRTPDGSGTAKPRVKRATKTGASASAESADVSQLLARYGTGPVQLTGGDNALYERHLTFDDVVALEDAGPRERYEAFARSIRDVLSQRWIRTSKTYDRENPKRVY